MRYDVQGYEEDVEKKMGMLYARLSEMDRRRYAAVEAVKLGHGGIASLKAEYLAAGDPVDGKVIPHGIYDLARNEGHVHLNTSHDTSEFCCDSVAHAVFTRNARSENCTAC